MTHVRIVSTYPPTQCGIATFTHSLRESMQLLGARTDVVRLVDRPSGPVPGVVQDWVRGSGRSARAVVEVLDRADVAVVQHEFGIYGGPDGQDLLPVVESLHVPVVVVLHTVPARPSPGQVEVLRRLRAAAAVTIVLSRSARDQLARLGVADPGDVRVIPHGADPALALPGQARHGRRAPLLLTWGLLGPGKGVEWALAAVDQLRDLHPAPRYLVLGTTHPTVARREGDRYVDGLLEWTATHGLEDMVHFEGGYVPTPMLHEIVRAADVVVLPYDSADQVTSGVLTEAVVAGKPVVATAFPHAVELLGSGVGVVVPHRDPDALADALRGLLSRPDELAVMARKAARAGLAMSWHAVAAEYLQVAQRLAPAPATVA